MLVVIAIIALLLAALLPAFSSVRGQAKVVATKGAFGGIDTGIASYRAETALGGGLPPSASDNPKPADRNLIANPKATTATPPVRVAGAHLLVLALMGADGLGTPGFRDVVKGDNDSLWWNDTFGGPANTDPPLYAMKTTGEAQTPRYGGYVDDKMRDKTKSLNTLMDEGKVIAPSLQDFQSAKVAVDELMFLDSWDQPILYYKANPSSLRMTSQATPAAPGIYWQEDNAILTGSAGGAFASPGVDFGAGGHDHDPDQPHFIHDAKSPDPASASDKVDDILKVGGNFEHTFAQFIIDPSIKARPTPVRKDSYLLISAGADGIYGSADDVLNWERKTE
jgi:type II secretory pathway pseudopilin PulG